MKFEDMIASGMLQVLSSKEHASLFKKAYKEESSASSGSSASSASSASSKSSASGKDSDKAWADDQNDGRFDDEKFEKEVSKRMHRRYPAEGRSALPSLDELEGSFEDVEDEDSLLGHNDTNDAKDKKHSCKSCGRDENNCMCGDKMYAKDGHTCKSCKKDMDNCMCGDSGMVDDNEVSDKSSASSKHSMALNVALESLLKASAALDYCGLGKGSELAVKVATLVVEAKKGKVDLTGKREESAKKHLRKLRELAEEESSLPKGRGESKSSNSKSSKPAPKKPVSKKSK